MSVDYKSVLNGIALRCSCKLTLTNGEGQEFVFNALLTPEVIAAIEQSVINQVQDRENGGGELTFSRFGRKRVRPP